MKLICEYVCAYGYMVSLCVSTWVPVFSKPSTNNCSRQHVNESLKQQYLRLNVGRTAEIACMLAGMPYVNECMYVCTCMYVALLSVIKILFSCHLCHQRECQDKAVETIAATICRLCRSGGSPWHWSAMRQHLSCLLLIVVFCRNVYNLCAPAIRLTVKSR